MQIEISDLKHFIKKCTSVRFLLNLIIKYNNTILCSIKQINAQI